MMDDAKLRMSLYGYSTLDCVYMYSFMYVVFILCILIFHVSLYFVTRRDWQLDNNRFIIIFIIIR